MKRTTKSSTDQTARAVAALKSMTPIQIAQLHIMQTKAAFKYMPEKHEQLTALLLKQQQALLQLKQAQDHAHN
jgi:hypothetical protein